MARERGEVPLGLVRPSIIESSLSEPRPGWIEEPGRIEPVVLGYGMGRVPDFPGRSDEPIDVIPVDLVANGIVSLAADLLAGDAGLEIMHVTSSSSNPVVQRDFHLAVRGHFQQHPLSTNEEAHPELPLWRFPAARRFMRHAAKSLRQEKPERSGESSPAGPQDLLRYADLYAGYTSANCRFASDKSDELHARMSPDERERFGFEAQRIPWRRYIQDIYLPGIRRRFLGDKDTEIAVAAAGPPG